MKVLVVVFATFLACCHALPQNQGFNNQNPQGGFNNQNPQGGFNNPMGNNQNPQGGNPQGMNSNQPNGMMMGPGPIGGIVDGGLKTLGSFVRAGLGTVNSLIKFPSDLVQHGMDLTTNVVGSWTSTPWNPANSQPSSPFDFFKMFQGLGQGFGLNNQMPNNLPNQNQNPNNQNQFPNGQNQGMNNMNPNNG